MSRRPSSRQIDPAWPRARWAHLRRKVMRKMRKFRNSKEFALLAAKEAERREKPNPPPPQF